MLTDINGVPFEKFTNFTAFDLTKKNQKILTKEQIEKQKLNKQLHIAQLAYCSRDENGNIIGPRPKNPFCEKTNKTKEILNEIQTALIIV